MESTVVFKTRNVHSSVYIPEDLHAYAKARKISLSHTLAATLAAAAKAEEEAGTGYTATNQNPVPTGPQELHGSYEPQKNTSSGGMGE